MLLLKFKHRREITILKLPELELKLPKLFKHRAAITIQKLPKLEVFHCGMPFQTLVHKQPDCALFLPCTCQHQPAWTLNCKLHERACSIHVLKIACQKITINKLSYLCEEK